MKKIIFAISAVLVMLLLLSACKTEKSSVSTPNTDSSQNGGNSDSTDIKQKKLNLVVNGEVGAAAIEKLRFALSERFDGEVVINGSEADAEFEEYVTRFASEQRSGILGLLERYKDKNVFVFKTREEAECFLNEM